MLSLLRLGFELLNSAGDDLVFHYLILCVTAGLLRECIFRSV